MRECEIGSGFIATKVRGNRQLMSRILLVDDNVELAESVAHLLTTENHSVEVVHTGNEGWERARANEYDMLILDWDLPDLNGINILKRFRDAGGRTPVLMLTGHTSGSDKELGLDSGADDYLTKPFDYNELAARVRAMMRRAGMQAPVLKALGTNNEDVLGKASLAGSLLASRYEFLEVVGEGGAGLVFKAKQPMMERLVAIKMLHSEQLQKESIERFQREAKAISRLDHHNIITIHDFGVTERGQPFMVMEYIEGLNLADLSRQEGALPLAFGLDISIQICDGMTHAHETGILHRDIKPNNLLLKEYTDNRAPIVKILDFGLAKLKNLHQDSSMELTQFGQIFGSPIYMSPEQVRAEPLDERSDIYSVGCVLYQVLTGVPPHLGKSSAEVMAKHLTAAVMPLREMRPDLNLPESMEPVISKVLSKDPEERYQSMRVLREDLMQIRSSLPMTAGGASP